MTSENKPRILKKLPDDLTVLADAVTTNNKVSSRIWLFAASTTVLMLSAKVDLTGDGATISFLSVKMEPSTFYLLAGLVLGFAIITFCSTRAQAIIAAKVFHSRLIHLNALNEKYTPDHKLITVAYTLPSPDLVRIFPLVGSWSPLFRDVAYLVVKLPLDTVYALFPLLGMLAAHDFVNSCKFVAPKVETSQLVTSILGVADKGLYVIFILSGLAVAVTIVSQAQLVISRLAGGPIGDFFAKLTFWRRKSK